MFRAVRREGVAGYYTLWAGAISREWAPKALRRNSPDILPVLLLGRLAIDQRFQNQGLGHALLRDALIRSINVASEVGVSAILVACDLRAGQALLHFRRIATAANDIANDHRDSATRRTRVARWGSRPG